MDPVDSPAAEAPGRLGTVLRRWLMGRATVVAAEALAGNFRLITLQGPGLKDVDWKPGQKVQIAMGSAFATRTYTPLEWDARAGRTRLLCHVHGNGPGSAWVRGVETGNECELLGPRSSLDVSGRTGPLAICGDETSFGLAHAIASQDRTRVLSCCFEVGDVRAGNTIVSFLGFDAVALVHRQADDRHVQEMEQWLGAHVAEATFVLTGKAATIQRLRQALKQRGVPSARVFTKAYWAPGKKGLD